MARRQIGRLVTVFTAGVKMSEAGAPDPATSRLHRSGGIKLRRLEASSLDEIVIGQTAHQLDNRPPSPHIRDPDKGLVQLETIATAQEFHDRAFGGSVGKAVGH